jgi:DNA-binding winged helix-turn-helix (wHTH) protein
MLATEPRRVFTREELLLSVWGLPAECNSRTLDSHAARLRQKLGVCGDRFVVNVWGVGYRLADACTPLAEDRQRFLITETSEYLVEAATAEEAEAIHLDRSPGELVEGFVGVVNRMVEESDA